MTLPRFITFEGGEGAGKTSLIQNLATQLRARGYEVLVTREPGGTALGEKLRALVLGKEEEPITARAELMLFLASRAQHVDEVINPALRLGKIVLCDRFTDSSLAYQGEGRGLNMDILEPVCIFATGGLVPDLTFYLDVDPKIGLMRSGRRAAHDRMESEKEAFHHHVRAAFHRLVAKERGRIQVLDASQSMEDVLHQALTILKIP